MLPTMYHSGILVATLFSVALGGDLDLSLQGKAQTLLPTAGTTEMPLKMSEFCFFGKFPSASCRFKCHLQNLDSYCNEEEKKCLCSTPEEEEDSQDVFDSHQPLQGLFDTPTHSQDASHQESQDTSSAQPNAPHFAISMHPATPQPDSESQDQTEEQKHHVIFYIFDLNKIFGKKNQSETSEGATTTDNATQTESGEGKSEGVAPAGWAFQHLMALLIIILLSVLIVLELYACYKKQSGKNHMESIFKTIPVPNKA